MIARKIFLQKLLLKKVSVDIHVTQLCNLCILNTSKKDRLVFPLGDEGDGSSHISQQIQEATAVWGSFQWTFCHCTS